MTMNRLDDVVYRVKSEFLEMPGLRLTPNQAQRLWDLRPDQCEHVLTALVRSNFLHRTDAGSYLQRSPR